MNQPWDTNYEFVYSKQSDPLRYCAFGHLSACVCSGGLGDFMGPVSMGMAVSISAVCISEDF